MNSDILIIAEAGTCHADDNTDNRFDRALEYVYAAVRAGAGAIKFQIFDNPNSETMFCWIDGDEERSKRWIQSRLDLDKWITIKQICDEQNIIFLASVFEYETVKWLTKLEVDATKIASRAANYIDEFKNAPKPLFVSNGMTDVRESKNRIIFECEANYPSTAKWENKYPGFSDHSGNPSRAIDAITRGCKLIEVHFYISPSHAGADLPASLSVKELGYICDTL